MIHNKADQQVDRAEFREGLKTELQSLIDHYQYRDSALSPKDDSDTRLTYEEKERLVDVLGRAKAALAPRSPDSTSKREEIARIVKDAIWHGWQSDWWGAAAPERRDAVAKEFTSAILSLFPEAGEVDLIKKKYSDLQATYLRDIEAAERSRDEAIAEIERLSLSPINLGEGVEHWKYEHASIRAQLEQAKEALEPFACALTDSESFVQDTGYARSLPIGHVCTEDFRRARETLSLIEKEGGDVA